MDRKMFFKSLLGLAVGATVGNLVPDTPNTGKLKFLVDTIKTVPGKVRTLTATGSVKVIHEAPVAMHKIFESDDLSDLASEMGQKSAEDIFEPWDAELNVEGDHDVIPITTMSDEVES